MPRYGGTRFIPRQIDLAFSRARRRSEEQNSWIPVGIDTDVLAFAIWPYLSRRHSFATISQLVGGAVTALRLAFFVPKDGRVAFHWVGSSMKLPAISSCV